MAKTLHLHQNTLFVLLQAIDLAKNMKGDKNIITVDMVKNPTWNNLPDFKTVDQMHIFQAIVSRELPPERFGGVINLLLATRQCATMEEIEDSLVCNITIIEIYLVSLYFKFGCIFRDTCTVLDHISKLHIFLRYVSLHQNNKKRNRNSCTQNS